MQKRDIIKLTKTETNELLKVIREDEPNYGLILSLQYIYGRNVSEVYNLKKTDIDQENNTITFIMNGDKLVYPIHEEIKTQLFDTINNAKKINIFQEGDRPLSNVKDGINYYLHKKTEALNELKFLEGLRLTTKDFKTLRGQHLFCDGISILTIHELYHNTNSDGTKNTINYEALKRLLYDRTIDEIIEDTCLKVYTDHDFNNNPLFYVTDDENKEAIIEIKDKTFEYYGDESLKTSFDVFDFEELKSILKNVEHPGDYIYYNGLKFLKN